jgi:Transposase DDE domain group 1
MGTNVRCVVTSRDDATEALYTWYTQRGATENWIKDFKRSVKCDRLSCHRFWANQFRLLLHAAAYWLLDTLRHKLVAASPRTRE